MVALEALPDGRIILYIDDIALWAKIDEEEGLWQRTLAVIRILTAMGFMVNIRKSKLLTTRAQLVGMDIGAGLYAPINKPLYKLFG